jgi:hypothetical protein
VDWLEPRPMAGLRENVIYFPNPKKIDILWLVNQAYHITKKNWKEQAGQFISNRIWSQELLAQGLLAFPEFDAKCKMGCTDWRPRIIYYYYCYYYYYSSSKRFCIFTKPGRSLQPASLRCYWASSIHFNFITPPKSVAMSWPYIADWSLFMTFQNQNYIFYVCRMADSSSYDIWQSTMYECRLSPFYTFTVSCTHYMWDSTNIQNLIVYPFQVDSRRIWTL